nr:MAG TPA: Insect kinin peptide [Caudoviricetes sp.]
MAGRLRALSGRPGFDSWARGWATKAVALLGNVR